MPKENRGIVGPCAICGKVRKLTFEHIPPKSAYNHRPVKTISGEEVLRSIADTTRLPWDLGGLQYENNQRGSGRFSLCQECNNNTGHWYGEEYAKFASISAKIVTGNISEESNAVELYDIYPLRIIKQILSMFCSVCGYSSKIGDIREFVADKNAVGLNKSKYRICMYYTKSALAKQAGPFAILRVGMGEPEVVSEISAAPLGFILYFDPSPNQQFYGVDITNFVDFSYDDKCDVTIPIIEYEVNNLLPLDYRKREEIADLITNESGEEW